MIRSTTPSRVAVAVFAALSLTLLPLTAANADTSIDGPIDLGTATPFSVLAGSTVTNTGTSVLNGDVGLSPGTAIDGFPPGIVNGTIHPAGGDPGLVSTGAQRDFVTAYGVAASLTPQESGVGNLTGTSLTPGVYAGGVISLTGEMTLSGTAESVWVFQAASELNISSGARIIMTDGASACNVFWQVGSSATIGAGAEFQGTVLADQSITAVTGATIIGRLLAREAAVTLDTNTITVPTGCGEAGTVTTSPEVTSSAPADGRSGETYSHTVTASGTPTPTFAVSSGMLPTGLALDATTGTISGTPTSPGTYDFEITVSNGSAPDVVVAYRIVIADAVLAATGDADADALAQSGSDPGPAPLIGLALLLAGASLVLTARWRAGASRRA